MESKTNRTTFIGVSFNIIIAVIILLFFVGSVSAKSYSVSGTQYFQTWDNRSIDINKANCPGLDCPYLVTDDGNNIILNDSNGVSVRWTKNNNSFVYETWKVSPQLTFPKSQLASRYANVNATVAYLVFPYSLSRTRDFVDQDELRVGKWIFRTGSEHILIYDDNITKNVLSPNNYTFRFVGDEIRLYFVKSAANQLQGNITFQMNSWSINGSMTPAWNNSYQTNTTINYGTNKIELIDAVPDYIHRWRFDGNGKNDNRTSAKDLTANGGATFNTTDYRFSQSTYLDGTNDYWSNSSSPAINFSNMTLTTHIKNLETAAVWYGIAGTMSGWSSNGWSAWWNSNTTINICSKGYTSSCGVTPGFNSHLWNFYVGTFNSTNVKSAINGTFGTVGTATESTGQNLFEIGRLAQDNNYASKILLEDMRIYNRQLSDSELNLIANQSKTIIGSIIFFNNLTSGNVTGSININATGNLKSNYSVYYGESGGSWALLGSANQTDNQSFEISTKYQNTQVKVELYGNGTETVKLNEITFFDEPDESFTGTYIDSCQNLTVDGEYYQLNTNISSENTCIEIIGNNITLDGSGYSISYDNSGITEQFGVYLRNNYYNNTIKNLNIVQLNSSGSYSHGIYFNGVSNNTIYNNSISVNGTQSNPISFVSSTYNNISNNNLISSSTGDYNWGLGLMSNSNNNILRNNTINASKFGYTVQGNNNYFYDNIYYKSGTLPWTAGLLIYGGTGNRIENITSTGYNAGYAIEVFGGSNNTIANSTLTHDSSSYDVIAEGGSINLTMINFTIDQKYRVYNSAYNILLNNNVSNNVFLNTSAPSGDTIFSRMVGNAWTPIDVKWYDNISTTGIISYSIHGLLPETEYSVYQNGIVTNSSIYSDISGTLPKINLSFVANSNTSMRVLQGAPLEAPGFSSWQNNDTNNNTLIITVDINQSIKFNATANQTVTDWFWEIDNIDQGVDYDNFTTSWSIPGTKTVSAIVENENGTSIPLSWIVTVDGNINVTDCGDLLYVGATYVLQNNVSSNESCFLIKANNITLDLNSYWINYSITTGGTTYDNGNNAINSTFGYGNSTVKNGTILEGNSSFIHNYAIYFKYSANNIVENVTIYTVSDWSLAIFIRGQNSLYGHNIVRNNNVNNSNYGYAVELRETDYDLIENNTFYVASTSSILLYEYANNSIVRNNILTSGGGDAVIDTERYHNYNNIFDNNTITSLQGSSGIRIRRDSSAPSINTNENNTFINGTISAIGTGIDYYISGDNYTAFINTNFTTRKIYLMNNISEFKYLNNSVWVNTSHVQNDELKITRSIYQWSQTNVSFSDLPDVNGQINYALSGLLPITKYYIYYGENIVNETTDTNGQLNISLLIDTIETTITVTDETIHYPPIIESSANNYSVSSTFTVPIFTTIFFNATANQSITNWEWDNSTIYSQDTINISSTHYFNRIGWLNVSVVGTNSYGSATKIWNISVKQKPILRRV